MKPRRGLFSPRNPSVLSLPQQQSLCFPTRCLSPSSHFPPLHGTLQCLPGRLLTTRTSLCHRETSAAPKRVEPGKHPDPHPVSFVGDKLLQQTPVGMWQGKMAMLKLSDIILALGIGVALLQERGHHNALLQGRAAAPGVSWHRFPPHLPARRGASPSGDTDGSGDADSSHCAARMRVRQPTCSAVTASSNVRNCLYLNQAQLRLTGPTMETEWQLALQEPHFSVKINQNH